jgi:hypothetical protein
MLRWISGKAWLVAGTVCAAACSLPAWSVASDTPPTRPAFAHAESDESADAAPAMREDVDAPAASVKPPVSRRRSLRRPAPQHMRAAVVAAPENEGRRPASQADAVSQAGFQDDLKLEPIPERPSFVRPFRKIGDILPYDSYEPDPEIAAKDKCYNLCPRPKGGECEDCAETDAEGRVKDGLNCPDCPAEQVLRRVGRAPDEPDTPFIPRNFAQIQYSWEPTNMYHHPIYFEDVPLERYGHTRHYLIQPLFSNAKFALQLVGLPYQMVIYPVCSRQFSLGYYRPGEQAPYLCYQIPLNLKAAIAEAGVISGAYFIFAPGVGP